MQAQIPEVNTLILGRVIERLIICVFGGVSLVCGWNLFRVGIADRQTAELAVKDWRIKLQRVGPGVFFALFGAAVLVVSLRSPVSIGPQIASFQQTKNESAAPPMVPMSAIVYEAEGEKEDAEKRLLDSVLAINTYERTMTQERLKELTEPEKQALDKSKRALDQLKNSLISAKFGNDALMFYNTNKEKLINGQAVSPKDRERLLAIQSWAEGTMTLK